MLLRVLEEGSMGISCIFILLPENGGSPAFIPVQCSFKKGKSLHQTSCIISKPFHPACECSESLEASNETCPVLPPHARAAVCAVCERFCKGHHHLISDSFRIPGKPGYTKKCHGTALLTGCKGRFAACLVLHLFLCPWFFALLLLFFLCFGLVLQPSVLLTLLWRLLEKQLV